MGTGLDLLVIGNCILKKQEQDETLSIDYKEKLHLIRVAILIRWHLILNIRYPFEKKVWVPFYNSLT